MEATNQAPAYPTGATRAILVLTAISCALLELIDVTVVNVALREISGNIGATITEIAWVVTGYSIANVIMIPLSAMLSDVLGRKVYFTASVITFTFASFMCGISSNLWMLVFWRFVQGLGGGGLLSTAQSIIIGAFPPEKIGTATAIFGLGVILGPTVGPSIGGYITDNLSWHWIFFVNLPIGILASISAWRFVPNLAGRVKPRKIDWLGIALLILTIGPLQYVLEEGGSKDWFESAEITWFFALSVASLIGFIWRELSIDYPAVNIKLYRNYNLAMGSFFNLVLGMILFGSVFIFPVFVQVSLGWTATQTGVFMIPGALATAVGMMLIGRFAQGKNPKTFIIAGIFMTFSFLVMLSFASPDSNARHFYFPFILRGVGMAFMMMPILTLALGGLQGKDLAQATGLSNMMRQLGGAVGIALINIYLNHLNAEARGALMTNLTAFNDTTTERLNMMKQAFYSAGYSLNDATDAAYKMLDYSLLRQQQLVSYAHGFLGVGLAVLICLPIVFMIRYKKPAKGQKGGFAAH
ncbi:MAG: DHA2 family efflux MFS transporter permease subunit [Lewinella sp.]|nr:DHA2 family efflux MFS transporter permease subunit [Lewinella sp.]